MTAHPFADSETSSSLLVRARRHDPEAWRRMTQLYGPVVYGWVRAAGFREHDAADVVQEVFQAVYTSLDRYQPSGRFRDWLWTIARRRAIDVARKRACQPAAAGGSEAHLWLQELPQRMPEAGESKVTRDAETDIVRRALELVKSEFTSHTWQACMQTAVEGRRPADVASDLEMTIGAVYAARSRVLKRLRAELDGLI